MDLQLLEKELNIQENLMTVRIAKILGLEEILDLSKKIKYLR